MLRWGGAFKRYHGAAAHEAAASAEVFGVCGAACILPRALFEELHGFDEHFFVSHEDVDLSYRARLLGYRCRYVADAIVRHHGSATLGKVSAFGVFHGQRNLEWVYLKNTPTPLLAADAGRSPALQRRRRGALCPASACSGPSCAARWRRSPGCRACCGSARRCRRGRVVRSAELWPHMERRWLSTKLREKRFDVGVAGGSR